LGRGSGIRSSHPGSIGGWLRCERGNESSREESPWSATRLAFVSNGRCVNYWPNALVDGWTTACVVGNGQW